MRFKPGVYDEHGNQLVWTGHQGFDEQTNLITWGNVMAPTMHGTAVRSWNNIEKDGTGKPVAPGHYFRFDTDFVRRVCPHMQYMLLSLQEEAVKCKEDHIGWLYVFFHLNRQANKRMVHGCVLTSFDHNRVLYDWFPNNKQKSYNIIKAVTPYVVKGNYEEVTHE